MEIYGLVSKMIIITKSSWAITVEAHMKNTSLERIQLQTVSVRVVFFSEDDHDRFLPHCAITVIN